ncbi:AbrB family transcriptional regulator [Ferroacidibacillus organovorans]|uniref:AbrB family transcriptional regulator n=2 Tax=Ferroacidibacillus organovorans TaxID=1765683 RepID=A0A162UG72_9BACL|nr:AbrB family transcriptional regulator [Ferroacidibacillus organovorans]OAG94267.1 AbrB family transcriptional regulator [Ferroacidibacillus organovorans]OPG16936.1 AbrB family transcriptional regulator [Ferroacidibacillus organovorans]
MDRVHRKITRIGNSLGVTFAKDSLRKLNLNLGDDVDIIVNEKAGEIVIRKAISLPQGLDPAFFETLETNANRYRQTIEGLKDR